MPRPKYCNSCFQKEKYRFIQFYVGEKAEIKVLNVFRHAFANEDGYFFIQNYKHSINTIGIQGKSSANDIVLVCPKGIFQLRLREDTISHI